MAHCHSCGRPLRPEFSLFRDPTHGVEYCTRCGDRIILERTGFVYVPAFRGVHA